MDVVLITVVVIGGPILAMALCFIAVGIWIGTLEEMKWQPGEPFYYLMDKIICFTRRVIRRLKHRGKGNTA